MDITNLYSKRKSFSRNLKFDRQFLEAFKNALVAAGFTSVQFRLPHNLLRSGTTDLISYDEFIKRERNYPSTIIQATNPTTGEIIKALFVNISTKAFFKDDTFPSGHSEPSELYVLSTPDRLEPLFDFYYNRFFTVQNPARYFFEATLGFGAFFLTLFYVIGFFAGKRGLLYAAYKIDPTIDLLVFVVLLIILFNFFNRQTGLYVKDKEFRPSTWFKMALKGEFRDNPVVNILIVIIGGLILTYITHLLGWT